jgi:dTDP-4-dehydrorhamnose reductase
MRILITGSSGQLARELALLCAAQGIEVIAPPEQQCDITDPLAVRLTVQTARPDVIVNCAAYNLVDQAETDRDTARRVNAEGPRILAEAARTQGCRIVHYSSDYVFDGAKTDGLYTELDGTSPLNEYGRSKLAGEKAVRELAGDRGLVLRLSWVFGSGTQNFIHKFRQRVQQGGPLTATCDEFSVPTWTGTVARVTLRALEQGLTGLFHCTNTGYCSRFDWARAIVQALGNDRFIRPVPMASFNLPARRPLFSAMSNQAIARALDISIEPWEEAVTVFVRKGAFA